MTLTNEWNCARKCVCVCVGWLTRFNVCSGKWEITSVRHDSFFSVIETDRANESRSYSWEWKVRSERASIRQLIWIFFPLPQTKKSGPLFRSQYIEALSFPFLARTVSFLAIISPTRFCFITIRVRHACIEISATFSHIHSAHSSNRYGRSYKSVRFLFCILISSRTPPLTRDFTHTHTHTHSISVFFDRRRQRFTFYLCIKQNTYSIL